MKWIYQMNRVRVSRGDKLILEDVTPALLPVPHQLHRHWNRHLPRTGQALTRCAGADDCRGRPMAVVSSVPRLPLTAGAFQRGRSAARRP